MTSGSTNGAHVFAVLSIVAVVLPSFAQITVSTGSILGAVSDPTGAVINGARITITNVATGQMVNVSTNPAGAFSSGALVPGRYGVVFSAIGFKSAETRTTVFGRQHNYSQCHTSDRK